MNKSKRKLRSGIKLIIIPFIVVLAFLLIKLYIQNQKNEILRNIQRLENQIVLIENQNTEIIETINANYLEENVLKEAEESGLLYRPDNVYYIKP